jgi:hypothetical protein
MTELQTYHHDHNDALYDMGPTDDDVMQWRAVMKGVEGTAYEGTYNPEHTSPTPLTASLYSTFIHSLTPHRWLLAPLHLNPLHLPPHPTHHPLHNAHLPPQRRFQNRRDLPRPTQDLLDARVHYFYHSDEYTSTAH